jgi:hypothetical protein
MLLLKYLILLLDSIRHAGLTLSGAPPKMETAI